MMRGIGSFPLEHDLVDAKNGEIQAKNERFPVFLLQASAGLEERGILCPKECSLPFQSAPARYFVAKLLFLFSLHSSDSTTMAPQITQHAFALNNLNLGLIRGDALEALKALPDNSFNVAITSPPYFWVRDYGVKEQIGHEDTLDEFIRKLADVFDEVRRVLHPEGVFYLNIGDTYYSGNGQPQGSDPRCKSRDFMRQKMRPVDKSGWDIPKKTLIGIPWKLAFEMQKRGWSLRSDIIWNRGNAFAEPSARDRPWRKYEHLFLFSKSRFYSYDRSALGGSEDVWEIPIERAKFNKDHNAPFPVKLVERCIATGCPPKGNVLDPFLGSGTTMATAIQMGRNCVGIDLKTSYVSEVSKLIKKLGAEDLEWNLLNKKLLSKNSQMETWPGCLRNMRKPGSALSNPIKNG